MRKFEANEQTYVIYTIDRFDIQTNELVENYAFALQPLIHVLGKRQFLICGQYCLPIFRGVVPLELERGINVKPRAHFLKMIKAGQINPLSRLQLVVRVGDLSEQVSFPDDWWPRSQNSMHHFGAQGPEVLAHY